MRRPKHRRPGEFAYVSTDPAHRQQNWEGDCDLERRRPRCPGCSHPGDSGKRPQSTLAHATEPGWSSSSPVHWGPRPWLWAEKLEPNTASLRVQTLFSCLSGWGLRAHEFLPPCLGGEQLPKDSSSLSVWEAPAILMTIESISSFIYVTDIYWASAPCPCGRRALNKAVEAPCPDGLMFWCWEGQGKTKTKQNKGKIFSGSDKCFVENTTVTWLTVAGWWGDAASQRAVREGPAEELAFELKLAMCTSGEQHPRGREQQAKGSKAETRWVCSNSIRKGQCGHTVKTRLRRWGQIAGRGPIT